MVAGNAIALQLLLDRIDSDALDEQIYKYLQSDISHLRTSLFKVLPSLPEVKKDLESFYSAMASVLVMTRTPLSRLVGLGNYLPGKPVLQEVFECSPNEVRERRVFIDNLARRNLRAGNKAAEILIEAILSRLKEAKERRERGNSITSPNSRRA